MDEERREKGTLRCQQVSAPTSFSLLSQREKDSRERVRKWFSYPVSWREEKIEAPAFSASLCACFGFTVESEGEWIFRSTVFFLLSAHEVERES